jgi:hypothetical protein
VQICRSRIETRTASKTKFLKEYIRTYSEWGEREREVKQRVPICGTLKIDEEKKSW